MAETSVEVLSPGDFEATQAWFRARSDGDVPPEVAAFVRFFLDFGTTKRSSKSASSRLQEFLRAMGIIPQTERRKKVKVEKDPQARAKAKIERLTEKLVRLKQVGDWHRARLRKVVREMNARMKKLKKMTGADDDQPVSPEEDAADISREGDAFVARIVTGTENGADPSLTLPHEHLISGSCIETIDDTHVASVSPQALEGVSVIQSRTENRVRYDFTMVLRRIEVSVEKKSFIDADGERRMTSASTADLGPPRFAVTWEFIAHVVILVVHYAMPFHRIARMLSTPEKQFTAGSIAKMIHYAASRFLPIHLHHFDALADAEILMGDDFLQTGAIARP